MKSKSQRERDTLDAPRREPKDSPLDVLKRRYAEGELSREEYEERKERLERER